MDFRNAVVAALVAVVFGAGSAALTSKYLAESPGRTLTVQAVRAHSIGLLDEQGNLVGLWKPGSSGGSGIHLFDNNGGLRMTLASGWQDSTSGAGPHVMLNAGDSVPHAELLLTRDGSPEIKLHDRRGRPAWSAPL